MPAWYPSSLEPLNGDFIKDQVRLLRDVGMSIDLVHADLNIRYLYQGFLKERVNIKRDKNGNQDVLLHGPTWPKNNTIGFSYWVHRYVSWINEYLSSSKQLPDIIHAHTYLGAIVSSKIKDRWKIPFVVTMHYSGWMDDTIKSQHKSQALGAIKMASQVLSVSNVLSEKLKVSYDITSKVVPNFIDESIFKPKSEKVRKGPFVLLGVGDLIPRKRWITLIQIFAHIQIQIPNAVLKIIGEGSERNKIEKTIEEEGLEGKVLLVGAHPKKRVAQFYNEAQLLVHCSRIETFGVIYLEALYSGIPVVTYENGAASEIIDDQILGYVIKANDVENFVETVCRIEASCDKIDHLQIRSHAIKKYGVQKIAAELLQLYDVVISKMTTSSI